MINTERNFINRTAFLLSFVSLLFVVACQPASNSNSPSTSPSPSASPSASPSPSASASVVSLTLPVLDALFSDEQFKTQLKSKVELTDDQVAQLQKVAADEVAKLREVNAEERAGDQEPQAELSRQRASEAIRAAVGEQKADAVFAFAREYWVKGGAESNGDRAATNGDAMLPGPNAVPKDTRVVVNIPAYRMDVFREGSLVKSYKVGIGYPDFPLPTGLRKAQSIIFNPTWTPPDEPWVAKMKGVAVGEKVAAGSKLNPLGPIKIPIGLPSLIHGGKSPGKLGTFASHGCVGLTTAQVQDFSKLLAQISGSELSDKELQAFFKDKSKTQTVKLDQVVPVELRYETIVVEDGKLHIYRDVYDHNTNTEENLRAVLSANNVSFEELSEAERTEILDALNAMSRHPQKTATMAKTSTKDEKPAAAPRAKKLVGKNQKEVVIELASLKGKGYPTAVNLDTGSGKPAATLSTNRSATD